MRLIYIVGFVSQFIVFEKTAYYYSFTVAIINFVGFYYLIKMICFVSVYNFKIRHGLSVILFAY